ncbi:hypothetical protein [Helicobacter cetorum]|uniref:hypothetical protein n=1 Tax=Helicobacter cetorum TaxID=138563 RepID=UPI000CF198E2|nr:hypothetical protein [Helicobacter cetorum]
MKKFKFLAPLIMGLVLVGCGDNKESNSQEKENTQNTSSQNTQKAQIPFKVEISDKELLNKCAKQEILMQVGAIKAMPDDLKEPCAKAYNEFVPAFKKTWTKFYSGFGNDNETINAWFDVFYGVSPKWQAQHKKEEYLKSDEAIKDAYDSIIKTSEKILNDDSIRDSMGGGDFNDFKKVVKQKGGIKLICAAFDLQSMGMVDFCKGMEEKAKSLESQKALQQYAENSLKDPNVGVKFYSYKYLTSDEGDKFYKQVKKIIAEDKAKKEAKQKQQQQDAENERLKKLAE